MSSVRRILSSRANGARSRGLASLEGKQRSSQNALAHGLLARCTLMQGESPEALEALFDQHLERLGPADGVELGMVQEMVAAYWRLRRAWAIETRTFDNEVAAQPAGDELNRMAAAFADLAARPAAALLHRYETRLHLTYHRALQNLLLLRLAIPNPSPRPNPNQRKPLAPLRKRTRFPPKTPLPRLPLPPPIPSRAAGPRSRG